MTKVFSISEEFTSQTTNNLSGVVTGSIVLGELAQDTMQNGDMFQFRMGGIISGNDQTKNDKLQLLLLFEGEGGGTLPIELFDKAILQASTFDVDFIFQKVGTTSGFKAKGNLKVTTGKGESHELKVSQNSAAIGTILPVKFLATHTKSKEGSTIKLDYCYGQKL